MRSRSGFGGEDEGNGEIQEGNSSRDVLVARAAPFNGWRELMEPARRAARRMATRGVIEILQRGHVVDPASVRGPIRLRKA